MVEYRKCDCIQCPQCHGMGMLIDKSGYYLECPDCVGTGYSETCIECNENISLKLDEKILIIFC